MAFVCKYIYCFRVELSAEGAKRGVETPPEVFPPDDLPRPSRPKAGLGLVMMMMMMMVMMMMMMLAVISMMRMMMMMTKMVMLMQMILMIRVVMV